MKRIPLSQGKFAFVDDEDYEELSKYKWCAQKAPYTFYAVRNFGRQSNRKKIQMHRFVLNTPKELQTDHCNRNGLDNQKHNLRSCTRAQNLQNQRKAKNASRYKGIYWLKSNKKWQVHCKGIYFGYFNDEIEAAKIYDTKAKELFGEFAYLNFPEREVCLES